MFEDNFPSVLTDGTSIFKMLLEPRYVNKITSAVNQSVNILSEKVKSISEPAYISTSFCFVCNESYSKLLNLYGCPHSQLGAIQLDNVFRVLSEADLDPSKIKDTAINPDVIMKILDNIRFVSDDTLIMAWSKLLKKEVETDSDYSMRTVIALMQLSPSEARIFFDNAGYIFRVGQLFYYFDDFNLNGNDLLKRSILMECGFLNSEPISISNCNFFWNNIYVKSEGSVSVFRLTRFGEDIYKLIEKNMSIDFCKNVLDSQSSITSYSMHEEVNETQYRAEPIFRKSLSN